MISKSLVRTGLVPLLWGTVVAAPAAAQRAGTVEAGIFGRTGWFDESLNFQTDVPFGAGGRLGLYVLPSLALEASMSFTSAETEAGTVNYAPLHGRLVYNLWLHNSVALILGAGGVRNFYSSAIDGQDNGVSGLAGLRVRFADVASLRGEVTGDYMSSPINGSPTVDDNLNWGVKVGLSVLIGSQARDTDGDGVRDDRDACPGTAAGEMVDSAGCAIDSDGDGVADSRDRCANTPQGAPVDPTGCPLDTDGDGVADFQDRCPDTPSGAMADENGCPVDTDRDGVADFRDQCPGTPAGATVDANGCPVDTDADGVPDFEDRCPNTPAGATVDNNGCPVDSDGDGVIDSRDRCPNTPRGVQVDANGCPADSDNDGVPDGTDRCPNTQRGVRVDAVGCPILFRADSTPVVLEGVNFATNSDQLSESARGILDRVAQSLVANPTVRVEVAGHTDNTGSAAYNVQLSQRRASAVRNYLIQRGVDPGQVEARGYGPNEPLATNDSAAGRAQNRRVELRRLGS